MRKAASGASFILGFAVLFAAGAAAQDISRLEVPRTANAPLIDGRVGPAEWAGAAHVPVDIEYEPANVRTEANPVSEVDT